VLWFGFGVEDGMERKIDMFNVGGGWFGDVVNETDLKGASVLLYGSEQSGVSRLNCATVKQSE
jgi:hypothetical protein